MVGHGKVLCSIAIEVADRNGIRTVSSCEVPCPLKRYTLRLRCHCDQNVADRQPAQNESHLILGSHCSSSLATPCRAVCSSSIHQSIGARITIRDRSPRFHRT